MEEKTYDNAQKKEKIILIAVSSYDDGDADASLDELEQLARTAGAEVVAKAVQNREKPHPGTYIGKGKVMEVRGLIDKFGANAVACDDELTPAQYNNLSEELNVKVIDRTVMILDIFAKRATTSEGKLQVELAQLKYRASHLVGGRSGLSRMGGGIGARGPGEQKLETDRRLIKERAARLQKELEDVRRTRTLMRKKRQENPTPIVAIVGYTNAGKSTLLNRLTNAGALSEDKLFATLDPTTRKMELKSGEEILFSDTVGFIRKLPHHLIQAFASTLEEVKYADIILHVVDCSNPDMDSQMFVVYDVLKRLEVGDKAVVTAFNKADLHKDDAALKDLNADRTVKISAKYGDGIEEMIDMLEEVIKERRKVLEKTFGYDEASKVAAVRKYGRIIEEKYRSDGIYIRAYVPKEYEYMF